MNEGGVGQGTYKRFKTEWAVGREINCEVIISLLPLAKVPGINGQQPWVVTALPEAQEDGQNGGVVSHDGTPHLEVLELDLGLLVHCLVKIALFLGKLQDLELEDRK